MHSRHLEPRLVYGNYLIHRQAISRRELPSLGTESTTGGSEISTARTPSTFDFDLQRKTEERADGHDAREHADAAKRRGDRGGVDDVGGDQKLEASESPVRASCRRASASPLS